MESSLVSRPLLLSREQLHGKAVQASNGRNHNDHEEAKKSSRSPHHSSKSGVRIFKHVESLTNQLVATDKNFQAIYDAIQIQLALFMLYSCIRDSIKAGRIHFDVSIFSIGLGSNSILCLLETYLLTSFVLVYPSFKLWKYIYSSTTVPKRLSAFMFILLFASYVLSSGIVVAWVCLAFPLPPFTAIILSVEQLRLSMKSYSFIRENAYKVLYPWHKDDEFGPAVWYAGQMSPQVGSFSQFIYFLFAPTFLYRDHYPRNEGPIKWRNVGVYLIQFVTTIWYLGVLSKDFTFPASLRFSDLVQSYVNCLVSAFFGLLLVHTCVFHAYMNFSSELLRFADREFYQDWWTSTSFSSYYRKWNRLVHDWIYLYLYTDIKSVIQNPLVAVFTTIFVSAFIHEYLLALTLRFASPILLLEFAGLGVIFYLMQPFGRRRLSNLFVLVALCIGAANLAFYYQAELAARIHCPKELNWITFFKPRLYECYYSNNHSTTILKQ